MKTKLSQAIAAIAVMGAATAATAQVNPDGLGQALLFPLYTVENGNQTTIHLTNTTADYKAVKVRFRRATDSADALDFNLYLSPHDMWTGVVTMGDDRPVLTSHDTSCISAAPEGLKDGQEFGVSGDATKGHIEVIEMANWTEAQARAATVQGNVNVKQAVEHVVRNGKRVPGNCAAVHESWNEGGHWDNAYANGVGNNGSFEDDDLGFAPKGGLYGNAYVINVDEAWAASYAPTAVDVYTAGDEDAGNNHHAPKFGMPDLQGPVADIRTVVLQTPDSSEWPEVALQGRVDELAGIMNTSNNGMLDAADIANSLRATNLYADYTIASGVAANTELAVTFPMRYAGFPNPNSQVRFQATFTDREEAREVARTDSWQWSPWVPGANQDPDFFRNEVNLIKLTHKDDDGRVDLGDWNHEIPSPYLSGWVDIEFTGESITVNLDQLEIDYLAYESGYQGDLSDQLTRKEFAELRLNLTEEQVEPLMNGGVYRVGSRTVQLGSESQPVIGLSNIVIKNGQAIPGVNNTYAITHELKYQRAE